MPTSPIMLIVARPVPSIRPSKQSQLMLPRDVPDSPWQELAADFFTHNHEEYLLIVDTYSKYPFIYQTSKTAESINKKLQNVIS